MELSSLVSLLYCNNFVLLENTAKKRERKGLLKRVYAYCRQAKHVSKNSRYLRLEPVAYYAKNVRHVRAIRPVLDTSAFYLKKGLRYWNDNSVQSERIDLIFSISFEKIIVGSVRLDFLSDGQHSAQVWLAFMTFWHTCSE